MLGGNLVCGTGTQLGAMSTPFMQNAFVWVCVVWCRMHMCVYGRVACVCVRGSVFVCVLCVHASVCVRAWFVACNCLQADWAAASDAVRQRFETLSLLSLAAAAEQRATQKKRKLTVVEDSRPALALLDTPAPPTASNPSLGDSAVVIMVGRPNPEIPDPTQEYPISPVVLDTVIKQSGGVVQLASKFKSTTCWYEAPKPKDFPKQVKYPRQCVGMCRTTAGAALYTLQATFLERLALEAPPSAVKEDAMFAIVVRGCELGDAEASKPHAHGKVVN